MCHLKAHSKVREAGVVSRRQREQRRLEGGLELGHTGPSRLGTVLGFQSVYERRGH